MYEPRNEREIVKYAEKDKREREERCRQKN